MLASIFLLFTTTAGYLITRRFFPLLSVINAIAAGWIIGVLLSTWMLIFSISQMGYDRGITVVVVIFALLNVYLVHGSRGNCFLLEKPKKNLLAYVVIWGALFFSLLYRSSLFPTENGYSTAPYTYGDIALHATMINYFAQQDTFSLQNPLFSQDEIRYPFLINFYTSVFVRLGFPIQVSLIAIGMTTILSTFVLLFAICSQLSKNKSVPWIASMLFFLNGGWGWWLLFRDANTWSGLIPTLQKLPFDYTNIELDQLFWTNITTTHVLPQRGFMIGLAIVTLCLFLLQNAWNAKKIDIKKLIFVGSVIGSSVLFHTHSFIFMSGIYFWILGWAVKFQKIKLKTALVTLFPIVLLGGLQLNYILSGTHNSFFQFQLGWKSQNNFLSFWLQNMGMDLLVLLVMPLAFFLKRKKQMFAMLLIPPSLGVYILCNIFIFQPNDWDNMKFMSLAFLVPCVLSAVVLGEAMTTVSKKVLVSGFIFFATISGILSIVYVQQNHWLLSSKDDIELAKNIRKITPSNSLFLTNDSHNHPVPMIAGRPIVLGYRGWLWTHGVEYTEVEQQVRQIYAGSENAAHLLSKLGIEYVFIGKWEKTNIQINEEYFVERFPIVLETPEATLYKVD